MTTTAPAYQLIVVTTQDVQLYTDRAPMTWWGRHAAGRALAYAAHTPARSRSFVELAKAGYYDGCVVHVRSLMRVSRSPCYSAARRRWWLGATCRQATLLVRACARPPHRRASLQQTALQRTAGDGSHGQSIYPRGLPDEIVAQLSHSQRGSRRASLPPRFHPRSNAFRTLAAW